MGRNDKNSGRGDPENKKGQQGPPRSGGNRSLQPAYAFQGGRARADDGRSGYGSESVRPYLRAQLRLKELLAPAGNLEGWVKRATKRGGWER